VTGAAEKIAQLNAMLEAYAKANRIKYVDYHSAMKDERGGLPESLAKDGVHPTREGYDIMKNLLLKAL
jgi:lysophospholipase L1-like esterase